MITPKTGSQTEIPDNAWKTISKKFSQQNQQPGSRVSLSKKVFLNIEESENNSTHHPRLAVLATSIKYFHFTTEFPSVSPCLRTKFKQRAPNELVHALQSPMLTGSESVPAASGEEVAGDCLVGFTPQ